jgi:hypothetical protein
LLIGTQIVVFGCGFMLWLRDRSRSAHTVSGSQLS